MCPETPKRVVSVGRSDMRLLRFIVLLPRVVLSVGGCRGSGTATRQPPVDILPADTCAVCGMYITHYPGPKAEAYMRGRAQPLKFGGLMDFFTYIRDPENRERLQALYVQDVTRINWNHPSVKASNFTDARRAWYVAGQPLCGEMGPTLASFARRKDAEAFERQHGGRTLTFPAITGKLLEQVPRESRDDPSCHNPVPSPG